MGNARTASRPPRKIDEWECFDKLSPEVRHAMTICCTPYDPVWIMKYEKKLEVTSKMSVQPNRYLNIGVGGRNCICCFPAPRSKDRRAQYRRAKRRADREAMRNAENDILDAYESLQELMREEYEYEQSMYDDHQDFYYYEYLDGLRAEEKRNFLDEHYDDVYFYEDYREHSNYEREPKMSTAMNAALSDLFFNHQHPQYDRMMQEISEGAEFSTEELYKALWNDAVEFCDTFNLATGNVFIHITPEHYAADFFARL